MRTPLGSHEAAGEPTPLIVDSRFIGWAMGGSNAVRSRQFTKDAMQPRTLWPDWNTVTANGWPISSSRSLWPEGIYQPITNFEGPSLSERCKGSTRPDDAGAWD